jgi:hypothetical protein
MHEAGAGAGEEEEEALICRPKVKTQSSVET